jgi:hypothetical protein
MTKLTERQNAQLTAQPGAHFAESDRLEAQIKQNLVGLGYDLV